MAARKMVVVRCDATFSIGMGHLSRCLSLADALREQQRADVCFVMAAPSRALAELPRERGFEVHLIDASDNVGALSAADYTETSAVAARLTADWLVVDSYGASARWLAELARRSRARLAVIDDLAERDLSCADLVSNPTPGSERWDYSVGSTTQLLCGAPYTLMHPAFAASRARALADRAARNADGQRPRGLICLGGLDATGATARVLEAVARAECDAMLRVIYGGGDASALNKISELVASLDGELVSRLAPEQLAATMAWADWAIATPSTIAWELSCMGVRPLLIKVADNQRRIANELGLLGVPLCLDSTTLDEDVARLLSTSRSAADDAFAALCDGEGAHRLAAALCGSA